MVDFRGVYGNLSRGMVDFRGVFRNLSNGGGFIPVATTFPGWGSATIGASPHPVYALGGPNYLN